MDVSPDTLESGANFYRIRYYIDKNDDMSLTYLNSRLLADEYEYIPSNVGTQYVVVMKKSNMEFLIRLQKTMETLKNYYISLFYHANIQTFVYRYHDMIIYDPYCIEFIIRNKVMNYVGEYMYIQQAVHYPYTFSIEYDNTIFKNVEEQDPELHLNSNYAVPVHDPNSLLVNRMEEYYELSVNLRNRDSRPINNIDMDLFDRIVNNNLYVSDEDPKLHKVPLYRNIIINHVNGNLERRVVYLETPSGSIAGITGTRDAYVSPSFYLFESDGETIKFSYHSDGLVLRGNLSDPSTEYEIEEDGSWKESETLPDGSIRERIFSGSGQLIEERIGDSVTVYEYNDEGDLIKSSSEDGDESTVSYYEDGRIVSSEYISGGVTTRERNYLDNGEIEEIRYRNGKPEYSILFEGDGVRVKEIHRL